MPLDTLDHYTINCADMEKTRDFYRDVLDLKDGFRPDLAFPGYWMYCGDAAVIHILDRRGALPENDDAVHNSPTGSLDHVAFNGHDVQAMIAKLKKLGITYRENIFPELPLHQLFVADPNNIMVELNFRERSEKPA